MQYPIIDNLIYAYLRNGWTGLELTEGKNLYNINLIRPLNYLGVRITVENDSVHVFGTATASGGLAFGDFHLNPGTYTYNSITENIPMVILKGYTQLGGTIPTTFTVTSSTDIYRFRVSVVQGTTYDFYIHNIQIEKGTEATQYEPYHVPDTDIANRIKLPLPHYFPHPVIDALQRASAGTQTADDTEVLRHYLTPLGIGGI